MAKDGMKMRGFYRVQIEDGPTGKIVGDSGWLENTIVNEGFDDYLCRLLGKLAGSKQVEYMALGTGTAPNATHTTLDGEISGQRKEATSNATVSQSTKLRFLQTFGSTDSFLGGVSTLQNVGLFNLTTSDATLFAGNTYTTSSCNTNQNVNVTYDITFS